MFTGPVMHLPGQELKEFAIYAPETRGTDRGREGLVNNYKPLGTIRAILAQATPEETQRWRQLNHPVSHKIIMQHIPPFEIKTGFVFELTATGQEFFMSTLPYEPGGIGHWTIFYCNDRRDVRN
jgi:hypothetical protein